MSSSRDQLHAKLQAMQEKRTGIKRHLVRHALTKQQRREVTQKTRKQGVKALMKQLGITGDKEIEDLLTEMIRSGEVQNPEEIVAKIEEHMKNRKGKQSVARLAQDGPTPEMKNTTVFNSVQSDLPGAIKRKTMRPLRDALLNISPSLQEHIVSSS